MNADRVYDRVHGDVVLSPLAATLSCTEEFMRLGGVSQLGVCAYVYPSATHTRREHSIGVAHLATVAARHLQHLHPGRVSEMDVLCVQVAALLHDIGHGPFSHLFEEYLDETTHPSWSHETMSIAIVDRIVQYPHVLDALRFAFGRDVQHHVAFIRLLVSGLPPDAAWPEEAVGRSSLSRPLVDLVHSKSNGIDVDRIDYLARDCLAVFGTSNAISVSRLVTAFRIHESKLVFDASVSAELLELHSLRTRMHQRVYQHRAVLMVESLLKCMMKTFDSLVSDDDRIAHHVCDLDKFLRLQDHTVLHWIASHPDSTLQTLWSDFHTRPWGRRLPHPLHLRTDPVCTKCGGSTRVQDAFCASCGHSTRTRIGYRGKDGGLRTHDRTLTTSDLVGWLCEQSECTRDDVTVCVRDIHTGTACLHEDPHGNTWSTFDVHKGVILWSRQDPQSITHPHDANPYGHHERSAYVFCKRDVSDHVWNALVDAVQRWNSNERRSV